MSQILILGYAHLFLLAVNIVATVIITRNYLRNRKEYKAYKERNK